jgi:uncharacterized protein YndB with AHSA1/START domain
MVDIKHRVGATVAPETVYEALTTRDGLAAWWTTDTTGDGVVGGPLSTPPRVSVVHDGDPGASGSR